MITDIPPDFAFIRDPGDKIENLHRMEIRLPFEARKNPNCIEAQRHTRDWSVRFGLIRGEEALAMFDAACLASFTSYWFPTASLKDLLMVADWNLLFFLLDDVQNSAVAGNWLDEYDNLRYLAWRTIQGDKVTVDHPLVAALSDLCSRTFPGRSSGWSRRFRISLEIWLLGHARQNAFWATGSMPDVQEYLRLRRDECTVYPLCNLVEIAEAAELPDSVFYHKSYQTIIDSAADIMCWTNDVHSLSVEAAGNEPTNMITILRKQRRLDLKEAVAEVLRLIETRTRENVSAVNSLKKDLSEKNVPADIWGNLERCIRAHQSAISGMELWDRMETNRFDPASMPLRACLTWL
jgi:hypothetical protein